MADITVTCTRCDGTLKVSEYADIDILKCRLCGAPMKKPGGHGAGEEATEKTPAVRLATPKAPPKAETLTDAERAAMDNHRKVRSFFPRLLSRPPKVSRRRSQGKPTSVIRYWALFIAVLLISAAIRWGNVISSPSTFDGMIDAALIFFGFLHLVMVTEAFRDDIFQGILCVFIPFYSLYYLVRLTDSLWLRAIGVGLLIPFGYDLMDFLTEVSIHTYTFISEWIAGGGA